MAEKKKGRKRSKIKRWLRSWVFTPLGNVKIKLINKVERKRRSIPDWDLKRIVSGALTDRCPCRFFRDRNDRQASSPGQRFPLETDYPRDPRGSWRGNEHCVLRAINPDMSVSSSEDGKSGELGPISVFQVDRNVYELSALGAMSPDLPAESSGEEKQCGQSHSALAESDVGMVNLPVEELAPQLPALYFIHQPDPPLCCLITSALQDCSSPVLFDNGICSYTHSSYGIEPAVQHTPSSDMPRSSINRTQPRMTTAEFLIRQTQRKGNAIANNRYISRFAPLQRQPLITRKECNVTTNTRNDVLSSIPLETSHAVKTPVQHPPYILRRKMLNGPLPPLPSSTSSSNQATTSSTPRSSPSPAADDFPQYPDRPTSMCGGCLAGRHRALHSHPYHHGDNSPQFGNHPLPYPLSPRELSRLAIDVDGLPTSLRSGPQCRHCSNRRSGHVSPPVLVGPRALNLVSSSFPDTSPDSPWAGPVGDNSFYATSAEDLPLVIDPDHIDESVGLSGLEMCLIAGSAARTRRYR